MTSHDGGERTSVPHGATWRGRAKMARLAGIVCCAACLALATTVVGAADKAGKPTKEKVFYPAPPDPPRLQLLTSLTGERDLSPPSSWLAKFVLGDDETSQGLVQPYGTAMYKGRLYVVDTGAASVAVFDLAAKRFSYLAGSANGQMTRPINISIDTDGTKYITDAGRDRILIYDKDDRFTAAFGRSGEFKPIDVAIKGDRLYVTDVKHHQVHVLDKHTGKSLFVFGKAGSGVGELFHPTNIAIGKSGDVYVSETSNFRIQRFTADGKPVRTYGSVGSTPGSFARPKGIAIDRAGRMLVSDAAFENVQMFDSNGQLLMFFGQGGTREDRMNLPTGVSIDYDNIDVFRRYADPGFKIEYLVFVASQFGPNKVDVYGFGRMSGMRYQSDEKLSAVPRQ